MYSVEVGRCVHQPVETVGRHKLRTGIALCPVVRAWLGRRVWVPGVLIRTIEGRERVCEFE